MQKRLLVPARVRQIPRQFSWIDQRLVRDNRLLGAPADTWALYLFLLTVADARGLSYYADPSIGRQLSVGPEPLARARQGLIDAGLIAYQAPLYQVLALDPEPAPPARGGAGTLTAIGEVLRRTLGEAP
ncbi:MAG: hypothetical protein U9Q81_24990 [Pseudomonadota bacterium]|nr:hypothetical protein [Pseudomonadota bacterium]